MPDTRCDLCLWEESARRERWRLRRAAAADWLHRWGRRPGRDLCSRMSRDTSVRLLTTALHLEAADAWFGRHRQVFVESGDPTEFERMMRHTSGGIHEQV